MRVPRMVINGIMFPVFVLLLLAGCNTRDKSTAEIWLAHAKWFSSPLLRAPVTCKEKRKGVIRTKNAGRFLIWEGYYSSRRFMRPWHKFDCVLAISLDEMPKAGLPIPKQTDSVTDASTDLIQGNIAGYIPIRSKIRIQGYIIDYTPNAYIDFTDNVTWQESVDGSMSLRIDGEIHPRDLMPICDLDHVDGVGSEHKLIRRAEGSRENLPQLGWERGFLRARLFWSPTTIGSETAQAILREHFLRLTDTGNLELAFD